MAVNNHIMGVKDMLALNINLTTKTILITGAAGFIGSNFVYLLLEERPDWKIVCVDALTYADRKSVV